MLRFAYEKNKAIRSTRWGNIINNIINTYELRGLDMSGGQFTWSNNQAVPTLEKLDIFLVSTSWEALFPLTTVHKLTREASDHNPVIIDTMETQEVKKNSFRFEKSWLSKIEFMSRG